MYINPSSYKRTETSSGTMSDQKVKSSELTLMQSLKIRVISDSSTNIIRKNDPLRTFKFWSKYTDFSHNCHSFLHRLKYINVFVKPSLVFKFREILFTSLVT